MQEQSSIKFAAGILALLLVAVPLVSTGGFAAAASSAGIMVPLYTYPGGTWDTVAQVKRAHNEVPIVAIVNPASGPGFSKDSNYESGIAKLKSAGVTVIGYVSTAYTNRDLAEVKSDMDRWKSWYPAIDGIFFDEQTNWAGQEWYYDQADSYAQSKGLGFTVGNPGANSVPSYLDTVDVVLIYESPGLPSLSSYQSWSSANNAKLGMIPFGIGSMPESWIEGATSIVGWIYVTHDVLPNPWDSVPPYLESMAELLDDGESTVPPPRASEHTLTVSSVDQYGNAADGMWMEVKKAGATVSSGFTPFTLTLEQSTYTVSASDYGQVTFDHWSDGTSSNTATLSLSSDRTLTAHYNSGPTTSALLASLSADTVSAAAGSTITFSASATGGTSPYTWSVNYGDGSSSTLSSASSMSKTYSAAGTYSAVATAKDSSGRTATSSPVTIAISEASSILTVKTVDAAGNPLNGYYTTLSQGDSQVQSAFSPAQFSLAAGQTYQVSVSDYGDYAFSRWDDGSTARTKTISIDSPTPLIAHYITARSEVELTVRTAGLYGSPITGLWTVIEDSGSTITGFSPVKYQAQSGNRYTVTVADYGNYVFDHWENGSKDRSRSVTPDDDMVITAFYRR
jgi:hypothetical protein